MYQKPLESTISSDQRPLPYLAIATPIPRPWFLCRRNQY
jgi:hypothetical protein